MKVSLHIIVIITARCFETSQWNVENDLIRWANFNQMPLEGRKVYCGVLENFRVMDDYPLDKVEFFLGILVFLEFLSCFLLRLVPRICLELNWSVLDLNRVLVDQILFSSPTQQRSISDITITLFMTWI